MSRKTTLEEFILRATKIHNNKYDYSLVREMRLKELAYNIISIWE
jgi:hypothetical protein